jgi:hypothetical protein
MNRLEELEKKYPKAFDSDWYGWECGDGWADIIEPIVSAINSHNQKSGKIQISPIQVKEKFGTLRFYCNSTTNEIDDLIDLAENKSAVTCETCGKHGELISASWLYTACPDHMKPGHRKYSDFIRERDSKEE